MEGGQGALEKEFLTMSFWLHHIVILIIAVIIGSSWPAEGSDGCQTSQCAADMPGEVLNHWKSASDSFWQPLHLVPVEADLLGTGLSLPLVVAQADSGVPLRDQGDEELREKPLWSGNVEVGIQIRQGNTETVDLYGKSETLRKSDARELRSKVSFDYAERDGDTSRSRAFAQSTYRRYRSANSYLFGTVNLEYDEIERLDFRLNAAVGPGYVLMDTDESKLIAEFGCGVTAELYDGEDQRTEAIALLHGQWTQKVFDRSVFSQDLTVYPSISDFGTFRLVSSTSLTTPLSESLDLRISLVDEYDNDPEVAGVKKNDLTFRTTLVFRF